MNKSHPNITDEQFDRLFPFFFTVNTSFQIEKCGKSIRKLFSCTEGEDFHHYFRFIRPRTEVRQFEDFLNCQGILIILELQNGLKTIKLRGQFEFIEASQCMLFIGTPWFTDISQLSDAGLTMLDFAIHDTQLDLLQALNSQESITADIRVLLDKINAQKKEIEKNAEILRSNQAQLQLLSHIAEQTVNGVVITDSFGRIEWVNESFSKITGYELSEIVNKTPGSVLQGPESDQEVSQYMRQHIRNGQDFHAEIVNYHKNGSKYWIKISGHPIKNEKGEVVRFFALEEDITKRMQTELALREAKAKADATSRAKDMFLANISHEIRTPLNAILGMSHLLYDTHPTKEQCEYLDILKNSAEMLRSLISDVLDLSKIRAGKLEVQQKEFDLVGLVRSLVKSSQLRLEDRPLSIELNINPTLDYMVIGDDLLLNQILTNLIGNAEKFTKSGKIEVNVNLKSHKGKKRVFQFSISDTGIGIPKEKLSMIFHAFQQVDGDIKRKFGGTGLGLAIVKQLIELQGGKISVKSRVGKGSVFTFNLPYLEAGLIKDNIQSETPQYKRLNADAKKLLVVEDNYMNRKYIGSLLEKWNVPFVMAVDGRKGLTMAQQEHFDMILMDIQMPEMDGYETTIAIRQSNNPNRDTPILALTASALISQKDKAFKAGFSDYLSKPFRPDQLYEKIEKNCKSIVYENRQDTKEYTEGGHFAFDKRLDTQLLTELYGDDWAYAADMFETFVHHTPTEWRDLSTAFVAKNWQEVSRLAHKIKPTFGMVGLSDMEQMLLRLENIAQTQPIDEALLNPLFGQIEQALPAVMTLIASELEKLNTLSIL